MEVKFVRDNPQHQSLLNEVAVAVGEQQLKQMNEEQEEHAVVRTTNDTNETAKEVKAAASRTETASVINRGSTGSQSQIKVKSTSNHSLQIFDMTVGDNISKVKQDI